MNRKRLGVWLSRRVAVIVGLSSDGRAVAYSQKIARSPDQSAEKAFESVLSKLPSEWHSSEIRIALSPCYLACCDCFEVPFKTEHEIETTAASIIESRCAGENAEELAMDIRRTAKTSSGSRVQAVAIRQTSLKAIRSVLRKTLPGAELGLVTGAAPILAQTRYSKPHKKTVLVLAASESLEAHIVAADGDDVLGWRSFSFDYTSPDFANQLQLEAAQLSTEIVTVDPSQNVTLIGNVSVEPALAVAMAAALVDPKHVVDLLRGAHDAPKSSIERLKMPLIAACIAIISFCASIGMYFHLQSATLEQAIADGEAIDRKLSREYLHGEKPDADGLVVQMNKQLRDQTKRVNANRQPSVLAFWSEVAQALPSPERIGLVTDSLQLGHEEGRLIGRVSRGQDDALKNASLLETNLNRSGQLSAHGEFETKETEILVRLRMNYHPKPDSDKSQEAKP